MLFSQSQSRPCSSACPQNLSTPSNHNLLSTSSLVIVPCVSSHSSIHPSHTPSQGIYIGDTYFQMRYSEETTQNDLYLRTSSATKKNAPLKLHANVVGKFSVERVLGNGVRDKVRESTQDAANQRNSRTTVFIETPSDLPSTSGKKRKDPPASMFRKPLRPSDKPKPAPVPALVSKLPPVQRDTAISPLRKHIIRLLAVSERTVEDIMNSLNASERNPPSHREIQDLLEQVSHRLLLFIIITTLKHLLLVGRLYTTQIWFCGQIWRFLLPQTYCLEGGAPLRMDRIDGPAADCSRSCGKNQVSEFGHT